MNSLGAAAVAGAAVLASGALAQAQTVRVNYSVPQETETVEMSNGLDADVTLDPNFNDFIDLTPGVTETNVLLSGGTVDLVQGSVSEGDGTLARPLSAWIGTDTPQAQGLSQQVFIDTYFIGFGQGVADVLITAGSPVTYDLGSYELTVTPRQFLVREQTSDSIVINNSADFLLQVVPEPTSGLLVLAGVGLLATRRRGRA
jgi:hypothetical protein